MASFCLDHYIFLRLILNHNYNHQLPNPDFHPNINLHTALNHKLPIYLTFSDFIIIGAYSLSLKKEEVPTAWHLHMISKRWKQRFVQTETFSRWCHFIFCLYMWLSRNRKSLETMRFILTLNCFNCCDVQILLLSSNIKVILFWIWSFWGKKMFKTCLYA